MVSKTANIVLIGMAGCGKSSVGKILASKRGMPFVDTDELIINEQQRTLQEIIDFEGPSGFRRIEEQILLNVNVRGHVIATGGSSIYSEAGMDHLRKDSVTVLLDVELDVLKQRVGDTSERGLVKLPEQRFEQVYSERLPLYKRNADITVFCSNLDHQQVCKAITEQLELFS